MMFPVNRAATELTETELMKLYDTALLDSVRQRGLEQEDTQKTLDELRCEIGRRMKPCTQSHSQNWNLQQMPYVASLGAHLVRSYLFMKVPCGQWQYRPMDPEVSARIDALRALGKFKQAQRLYDQDEAIRARPWRSSGWRWVRRTGAS